MNRIIQNLSLVAIVALAVLTIGAIRDETGTVRFRQGAVLSFDPQVTFTDEDSAWTMTSKQFGKLATGSTLFTTNQIVFSGTNTAPASTTIVKWVSVQIAGETNAYRVGLAW